MNGFGPGVDGAWNCRLTTTGRKSGQLRTVTLWFVPEDGRRVYLAGGPDSPQWVRNLRVRPEVELEIAGTRRRGRARVVEAEAEAAAIRDRFAARYVLARLSRLFGGYTRSVAVEVELGG
jgi:deazaflavin-dependent oxidoreductase (nitroreductase family)